MVISLGITRLMAIFLQFLCATSAAGCADVVSLEKLAQRAALMSFPVRNWSSELRWCCFP
jgi:hypothetical protein